MAKLYFRYGAMGSSKTANAIMVQYNYMERGQNAVILKPRLDTRDGARVVSSRCGLTAACSYIEELDQMDLSHVDCLIVDEAQFLRKEEVEKLVHIVDDRNIPVICYGIRADFLGNLFEGSMWLLAWADTIEEIKTVCWCGSKAVCNARIVNGKVARSGAQIVLGGNESYVALCRKHWYSGELAPMEMRRITTGREKYMPLLLLADPSEYMVRQYLDRGEMYALMIRGEAACVAIAAPAEEGVCELYNLATAPGFRHKGYASRMIRHLIQNCTGVYTALQVGTSADLIPFYEQFGFRHTGTRPDFFLNEHYDPTLFDEGEDLRDMEVLTMKL